MRLCAPSEPNRSMNAFLGSVRLRLWLNPAGGGTTATT
nr:MAG TPA: hypothetical protein [Caudoviricetes sp.]